MAKAEKQVVDAILSAEGQRFGPCGDCLFYIAGEGLGGTPGKGRCHGMPPFQGQWPGVPGIARGCSLFRARE